MIQSFFKQKVKFFVLLLFLSFIFVSLPASLLAQGSVGYGVEETIGAIDNSAALTKNAEPERTAGRMIGAILTWTGVLFLVLIFTGGIIWMTAGGNEQQVAKAKNLILAAILGLVIVMSAYAITAYIGRSLTQP